MITIPGKIPIHIYPLFWLLVLIIGWTNSMTILGTAIWAAVIFFSVLIHEYGHALTGIFFGQKAEISLVGLGGVTHRQGTKLKLWQEFVVVMNGPLAGILLYLAADQSIQLLTPGRGIFLYALIVARNVNFYWTILNLLPIHPLDGGRLFSIVLESLFGSTGIKVALFFSCLAAFTLSVFLFVVYNALFIGSLFLLLAFESYRAWKEVKIFVPQDRDGDLQVELQQIEEQLRTGKSNSAVMEKLRQIRDRAQKGVIYLKASEYYAMLLSQQRHLKEAYEVLKPLQSSLSQNALGLLHQLAYYNQDWKEAIVIGNRFYQHYPHYNTALTNALCYAALKEVRPAVGWLQRAIHDGLPNSRMVISRQEFDAIRSDPKFRSIDK